MRRIWFRTPVLCAMLAVAWGCEDDRLLQPDPQYIGVHFNYLFRDEVDTFNGTLTKDLAADGAVTVPFWFTRAEQDSILAEALRDGFFLMPDTMRRSDSTIFVCPDPGAQVLRIQAPGMSHQVVWYITSGTPETGRLAGVIWGLVTATPQYRSLPPARGGYL